MCTDVKVKVRRQLQNTSNDAVMQEGATNTHMHKCVRVSYVWHPRSSDIARGPHSIR